MTGQHVCQLPGGRHRVHGGSATGVVMVGAQPDPLNDVVPGIIRRVAVISTIPDTVPVGVQDPIPVRAGPGRVAVPLKGVILGQEGLPDHDSAGVVNGAKRGCHRPKGGHIGSWLLAPAHPAGVHVRGKPDEHFPGDPLREPSDLLRKSKSPNSIDLLQRNSGLYRQLGMGAQGACLLDELADIRLLGFTDRQGDIVAENARRGTQPFREPRRAILAPLQCCTEERTVTLRRTR